MTNYQIELDRLIASTEAGKRVLLHSCCAPCSSYVIEYLSKHFVLTVFYYNPNITDQAEYEYRLAEQKRLIAEMPTVYPVSLIEGEHDPALFLDAARGHEADPERGARCLMCYEMRLDRTAALAKAEEFDFFATTLTLSPLKPAGALNEIGLALSERYSVKWLPSDFKKRGGYLRSIELSKQYGLYRQNYCGCEYSRRRVATQ